MPHLFALQVELGRLKRFDVSWWSLLEVQVELLSAASAASTCAADAADEDYEQDEKHG